MAAENQKLIGELKLGLTTLEKNVQEANKILKKIGKEGDKDLLNLQANIGININSEKTKKEAEKVKKTVEATLGQDNIKGTIVKSVDILNQELDITGQKIKTVEKGLTNLYTLNSKGKITGGSAETLNTNKELSHIIKTIENDYKSLSPVERNNIENVKSTTGAIRGLIQSQEWEEEELNRLLTLKNKYEGIENRLANAIGRTSNSQTQAVLIQKQQSEALREYNTMLSQYTSKGQLGSLSTMFGGASGSADKQNTIMQKFGNSLIYGMAFRMWGALANSVTEAINANKEFELGIVGLGRTLEATDAQLQRYGKQAITYSKEYGVSLKEVQDAMVEIARAGIQEEESLLAMTEAVLMGLNTTEVESAATMVGYLVSAVKQLGLSMTDSMSIIDSWNLLADKYAVHSEDFAKAIEKSGAASKNLGLTLHDINAMVVILGEATQASGEQIGSALKSLEVRITRPDTVKALQEEGIQVKKNALEYLSFEEIMKNVARETEGLEEGSIKLSKVMDALGGSWRRNWAQILSQDWDRFNAIREQSIMSFGYSIAENIKVMDTYEKKVEVLKSTITEFFITLGEAGLMDVLKGVVKGLTSALNLFEKLPDVMKGTILTSVMVYGSLKLLGGGLKFITGTSMAEAFMKISSIFGKFKFNVQGVTKATELLTLATKANKISAEEQVIIQAALNAGVKNHTLSTEAATVQQTVFSVALKETALSAAGLQAALGLLPVVIGIMVGLVSSYSQKQKEMKQISIDNINKLEEEVKRVDELLPRYEELIKKTDLDAESKKELVSVTDELNTLLPNSIKNIEGETTALGDNTAAYKTNSETKRKELIRDLGDYTSAYASEYNKALKKMADYEEKYQGAEEAVSLYMGNMTGGTDFEGEVSRYRISLKEKYQEYFDFEEDFRIKKEALDRLRTQEEDKAAAGSGGTEASIFNAFTDEERLEKLLQANLISIEEYYNSLIRIRDTKYSEYMNKTPAELDQLLSETGTDEEVEKFLSLQTKINSTWDSMNKADDKKALVVENLGDRYAELNAELDGVNSAIALNQALQAISSDEEKIELINQENGLLKVQQDILHRTNEERRKQVGELKDSLGNVGFNFDDLGNITNLNSLITAAYDERINLMPEGTEAERATKQMAIDNMKEIVEQTKTYINLIKTQIPSASKEWTNLEKAIGENVLTIKDLQETIKLEGIVEQLGELEYQFDMLGEDNVSEKIDNIKSQIILVSSKIGVWKEQLIILDSKLKEGTITQNQFKEKTKELTENIRKGNLAINGMNDSVSDLTESIKKASNDLRQELTSILEEKYNAQIKALEDEKQIVVDSLNFQKDALKEEMDALQDLIDKKEKAYEDDFKAYKENVQAKYNVEIEGLQRLKELNQRNYDEKKYQEEQQKRYEELKVLETRYSIISKDTSLSMGKEKIDLQKEIAELRKEIVDSETEHNLQTQSNAIDDLIDLKEKERDAFIEAEEKKKDANIDALTDMVGNSGKTVAQYTSEIANIEAILTEFDRSQKKIIDASVDSLKGRLWEINSELVLVTEKQKQVPAEVAALMSGTWSNIETFIRSSSSLMGYELDSLISKMSSLYNISQGSVISTSTSAQTASSTGTNNNIISGTEISEAIQNEIKSAYSLGRTGSIDGIVVDIPDNAPYEPYEEAGQWIYPFDKGGSVKGKGLLSKNIEEEEIMLSPKMTKNFNRLSELFSTPDFSYYFSTLMPKLGSAEKEGKENPVIEGDIIVQVSNLDTTDDYKTMAKKVKAGIYEELNGRGMINITRRR